MKRAKGRSKWFCRLLLHCNKRLEIDHRFFFFLVVVVVGFLDTIPNVINKKKLQTKFIFLRFNIQNRYL